MTKLRMAFAVAALSGVLAAAPAYAQWGGDSGSEGGGNEMGEMMGALGLDDAQWAKFNELRRNYRKTTIKMQAKIDVAEVELEEQADTSDLDMRKIGTKIKEIADLNAKLRVFRYQTLKDMRGFIGADQFDTFRWMAMKMGFNFGDDGGKKKGGHAH